MLKLKKLQILGFKSFCDRTELLFPGDGVAAIVGPNGCGKSNISDAFSWVLGEQSAKSLRGARMEDVIFAGTRDRRPNGLAEVTLHLVDPEVYEGGEPAQPEIVIHDDLTADDWDEAALRSARTEEIEEYTEDVRPGQVTSIDAADGKVLEGAAAEGAAGNSAETSGDPAPEGSEANAEAQQTNKGVVLKIRRRKFKTQFKKGEIVVTRRLFRSGESEYLLNGKLCRLRDIQDIFMGTGLGPESYALIEQGRIGQILSSKPTDRRAMIEEAAGITKYKTRKRLAEARLEDARLNLSRVNDIFDEVTRQMNSLKRQASKAERYGRLRDEMRGKLQVVISSKFNELQEKAQGLESELTTLGTELQTRSEAAQALESEHAQRMQESYNLDNEAKQTRERTSALNLEMDRATARCRNNEERVAELAARSAGAEAEIAQTSSQLERLQEELQQNQGILESAAADVAEAEAEKRQRQGESQQAAQHLSEVERQQESHRRAVLEAMNAAAAVRNRITQAEERIAALERESERLQSELEHGNRQVEEFGGQRGQVTLEFETASQRVTAIAGRITDTRRQIEEKRREQNDSNRQLDQMRSTHATLQGKRASLESVIREHGYSTDSVRKLFQSGQLQGGLAPVGVLADFLEVEDRFEGVIDEFLREELNYVVVKSWDAAGEGLNLLRTDVEGRATFLIHPSSQQVDFPFLQEESQTFVSQRDTITPLKNCIKVLDGFGKSLEVIIPKLGNGYIVDDAETGRRLARENPGAYFLSKSGECFHNLTVTGGKQRNEGPLAMKRELREVQRQIAELEDSMASQQTLIAQIVKQSNELQTLLDALENERREADQSAMTSGHNLKQLDSEMARLRERLSGVERELQRVAAERENRAQFVAERQQELEAQEARQSELEAQLATEQSSLDELRQKRDEAAQAASQVMARVAALEERRRSAQSSVSRIQSMATEVNHRIHNLRGQLESAAAERGQREQQNQELEAHLAEWKTEHAGLAQHESELTTQSEQLRARLAAIDEELKTAREELDRVRDHRGELAAQAAKISSDTQHLAESCQQELGKTREEMMADETIARLAGEELATEEAAYHELRGKLENMGPVNMMALEEYNETSQRHEFLETQRKDLLDSIENTRNTIKEIDQVSREKFEQAFQAINENFARLFKKLFGGGQGFMKLTDEENSAESGIDIVASPPGKKLQNVLLLSGGEKAMTALALLVGIFMYQPSPFCILDEVDAPLDESNVARFTELVREMSTNTQFIIITHHKKTMSIAPVMYGVTMQEPGCSKIVSVRFNAQQEESRAVLA